MYPTNKTIYTASLNKTIRNYIERKYIILRAKMKVNLIFFSSMNKTIIGTNPPSQMV